MADWAIQVLAILGTFAIHSFLLLGVVQGGLYWDARQGGGLGNALRERLLRLALFGAILSTGLQATMGDALLPGVELASLAPAAAASSAGATSNVGVAALPPDGQLVESLLSESPLGEKSPAGPSAPRPAALIGSQGVGSSSGALHLAPIVGTLVLGLYALGVLWMLGLRLRASRRFARLIARRRPVEDLDALGLVDRLSRAAAQGRTVRLSSSPCLRSPVAFGWLRPEICVPEAMLQSLDAEALRRVCAHEMAHLRSGDPLWLLAYDVMVSVAWFQPLAYSARHRLRDLAEFRCDAWVVTETGDPVGMARTLVEVAEWLSQSVSSEAAPGTPAGSAVAPAMAHPRSPLHQRVTQILNPAAAAPGSKLWGRPVLWGVVCAFGVAVPGFESASNASSAPDPLVLPEAAPLASSVQAELRRLEGDIADLHDQLASAWRLLEGQDRPEFVRALQQSQARLQAMTAERQTLWEAATARQPR